MYPPQGHPILYNYYIMRKWKLNINQFSFWKTQKCPLLTIYRVYIPIDGTTDPSPLIEGKPCNVVRNSTCHCKIASKIYENPIMTSHSYGGRTQSHATS